MILKKGVFISLIKKKIITTLSVCLLLTLLTSTAFAGEMQESLLKGLSQPGENLTRAEYVSMLVQAAEIPVPSGTVTLPQDMPADAQYADALKAALAKGIIKGTADNTISPDQPITQAQAASILARALGLPGIPASGVSTSVPADHWAYGPLSWLIKDGVMEASVQADSVLSPSAGAALLEKAFGTTKKAKEIADQSQVAQAEVSSNRIDGNMSVSMQTNPAVPVQGMPASMNMNMQAKVAMEMNMEQGLHQQLTMTLQGLPQAIPPIEVEQYMVASGMYMKMKDPLSGEEKWVKMPEGSMPNFIELMQQQSKMAQLPKELEDLFHYRLLGEKTVGADTCYELAFSGTIPDLAQFMNLIATQANLSPELLKNFEESSKLVSGISMAGKILVNKETYLTDSLNATAVVTFADQFQNQPFPLQSVTAQFNFNYKDYNADIDVQLPEAAAQAESLPALQATPEPEPVN